MKIPACFPPLLVCEIFLSFALSALRAQPKLDAVLTDAGVSAVVCQLTKLETLSNFPIPTLNTFPWSSCFLLLFDTKKTILADNAAALFIPLMWREMLLELDNAASVATTLGHVVLLNGCPINILSTQLPQKQLGAIELALCVEGQVKLSVKEELVSAFYASHRDIARNRARSFADSQIHDGAFFQSLPL